MKSSILRTIAKSKSVLTSKLKEKKEFNPHYLPSKQIISQMKPLKSMFNN